MSDQPQAPLPPEVQNSLQHIRQALEPVEIRGPASLTFYANSTAAFNTVAQTLQQNADRIAQLESALEESKKALETLQTKGPELLPDPNKKK